jgi:S1-C subfamily serine protease
LPGDVIQAVNRPSIATLSELRATLARLRPGDPLVLQIDRQERILFVGMVVE